MGRKLWGKVGVVPFLGELCPHLTQCGRGRCLPPCQVSSWSIQPFGHNKPKTHTDRQTGRQTDRTNGRPKTSLIQMCWNIFRSTVEFSLRILSTCMKHVHTRDAPERLLSNLADSVTIKSLKVSYCTCLISSTFCSAISCLLWRPVYVYNSFVLDFADAISASQVGYQRPRVRRFHTRSAGWGFSVGRL